MCLIICKRDKDSIIPRNMLIRGMNSNPHGWGVMWVDKGQIKIKKGFIENQDDLFDLVDKLHDKPLAVHFRLATHGMIDKHNCHPFKVTEDIFLMHNGIINNISITKQHMSDTWHYAKFALAPMLEGCAEKLDRGNFINFIAGDVGSYNKLVMLRNDGKFFIVNETRGVEYNGLWLSNSGGLPYTTGFAPSSSRTEKKTSETTLSDKKIDPPVGSTPMDGNKYFIGCMVRTPEYFGLPESAASVYLRINKAKARGEQILEREAKFADRCEKAVKNNVSKANTTDIEDWCRVLRKNYTKDYEQTYKTIPFEFDREEARIPYTRIDKSIQYTKMTSPVTSLSFNHWCTECHKMFPTSQLWFNTEQMNTPLSTRKGKCNTCFYDKNKPVVTTSNVSSYRASDTVAWKCTICNKPNYYKDTWSKDAPSSADNPICYSCIYDEKRKVESAKLHANAEHCGLMEINTLSDFEINYWKDKSFLKNFFPKEDKKKEVINA